jgi:hypothetical protein
MPAARPLAAALVAVVATLTAAGCGGSSSPPANTNTNTTRSTRTAGEQPPAPIPERSDLALPLGVPDRATGPAERESRRVINAWLRALRRGDVAKAAHYFALPSKFQNATPVLTVDSEIERQAINQSLSCGAIATDMGSAGDYTIVTFKLVKRPGGDCGTGVGHQARGAIKVLRGHIKEWYRLPDVEGGEPNAPPAPSGPAI